MRSGLLRISLTLVAAAFASTAVAFADATPRVESTPIPNAPKPDFSSMKFSLGTWNCATTSSRRPTPFNSTLTTTLDATGYWMITKTVTPKVSWASAITSTDMVTYDSQLHRWSDVYTDDQGGYDVMFSPGWQGNTIVWTDAIFTPGPDIISVTPVTTTKVSDAKTTSHSTFKEKSGRTIMLDTVCTKA